ncbi:MAG TPA: hypothetical protein VEU62_08005 [Bryobacterales bacterium]|nr:hypothetical protein [Bryobacterales bacterium]
MDVRRLEEFVKQLREEMRIIDRVIATLEQIATGRPRRGRPPKFLSDRMPRIPRIPKNRG